MQKVYRCKILRQVLRSAPASKASLADTAPSGSLCIRLGCPKLVSPRKLKGGAIAAIAEDMIRSAKGNMTTEALQHPTTNQDALDDPSYTDHLTKIGNRRFFEERLNDCLCNPEAPACVTKILLLDLDRFKAVNDSLGHAVGDALLCRVVQRICSVLGSQESFARLGGDEFGILLTSTSDAESMAASLIELVQRTYLIDGIPVTIGVSIGLATAPRDATKRGELMRCADLALYEAKSAGRNRFVRFEPALAVRAEEKRDLEIALRKAVALRQLVLRYRPQMDIGTRSLIGLEAILQWKHPTRGILDAPVFMPLAEEIGMVASIAEWALKTACREASRWPGAVPCALSVSSTLFESEKIVHTVTQALTAAGIEGRQLELEVTEEILLRDGKTVLTTLQRLRSLGVRVSIDSFGTGMASFSQMVDFPIDKIKIAQSLVEETGTGAKERAIVRAIAALGASLGISMIVEGVTTQEHLERIQQDGCSMIQGCLIGLPTNADTLREMLNPELTIR